MATVWTIGKARRVAVLGKRAKAPTGTAVATTKIHIMSVRLRRESIRQTIKLLNSENRISMIQAATKVLMSGVNLPVISGR